MQIESGCTVSWLGVTWSYHTVLIIVTEPSMAALQLLHKCGTSVAVHRREEGTDMRKMLVWL